MMCPIFLTRYIKITGVSYGMLKFKILACCIGPKIELSYEDIDFGSKQVLQDHSDTLIIMNNSTTIEAYSTFLFLSMF